MWVTDRTKTGTLNQDCPILAKQTMVVPVTDDATTPKTGPAIPETRVRVISSSIEYSIRTLSDSHQQKAVALL